MSNYLDFIFIYYESPYRTYKAFKTLDRYGTAPVTVLVKANTDTIRHSYHYYHNIPEAMLYLKDWIENPQSKGIPYGWENV